MCIELDVNKYRCPLGELELRASWTMITMVHVHQAVKCNDTKLPIQLQWLELGLWSSKTMSMNL